MYVYTMRQRLFSFLIVFLLVGLPTVWAQSADSTLHQKDTVSWLEKLPETLGVEFGYQKMLAPTDDDYDQSAELAIGATYRAIGVGFFYHGFEGEIKRRLVFPNDFSLSYAYGGGYLYYDLFRKRWIGTRIQMAVGSGDATWSRSETNEPFERDRFGVVYPHIQAHFSPFEILSIYTAVGYRKIIDLQMNELDPESLSGFTIGIGMMVHVVK